MANANVGDYHDNFNHEVFKDWLNNRFIPFILATDPAIATGVPGARLAAGSGWILRLDNAPYHCVTTTNLNPAVGPIRFDPRKVTKIVLIDALQALGCVDLVVNHTYRVAEDDLESEDGEPERDADENVVVDDEGFVTVQLKIKIDINDAEKGKRAKMGSHPSVPEIQIAAYEWCVYNRPSALENDCEYILRTRLNGNCKPSWNSPNFPESMTCEIVMVHRQDVQRLPQHTPPHPKGAVAAHGRGHVHRQGRRARNAQLQGRQVPGWPRRQVPRGGEVHQAHVGLARGRLRHADCPGR